MAMEKKTSPVTAQAAASMKDKVDAVKAVSDSGRSTQETHRSAIDSEATSTDGFMKILLEQSKKADTPEERATIRREAREAQARHTEKINLHKDDSNTVFLQVLGFGAMALGVAFTSYLALKSKE
jgi:hypothetical protein